MISKLLTLFPPHNLYCEPFGGGASILMAKAPSKVEVYNDLDGYIVNLFRCLQNKDTADQLTHRLQHTLYSLSEFARAIKLQSSDDPIDSAWATFVIQNQGMSGKLLAIESNWSRSFSSDTGMAKPANGWIRRLTMLPEWHKRLLRVQIDCQDAVKCIKYWDTTDTLFYVDPPYVASTRKDKSEYRHEMTDFQHKELLETLIEVNGKVILSGYPDPMYNVLTEAGWNSIEFKTACYAAVKTRNSGLQGAGNSLNKVPRTEIVWMNYEIGQSELTLDM